MGKILKATEILNGTCFSCFDSAICNSLAKGQSWPNEVKPLKYGPNPEDATKLRGLHYEERSYVSNLNRGIHFEILYLIGIDVILSLFVERRNSL